MANAEAWFNIALRPRKPEGLLGRTAQDGHLDSHTAPELCARLSTGPIYTVRISRAADLPGFRSWLKYLSGDNLALNKPRDRREKRGRPEGRGGRGGGRDRESETQRVRDRETEGT